MRSIIRFLITLSIFAIVAILLYVFWPELTQLFNSLKNPVEELVDYSGITPSRVFAGVRL